MMVVFTLGIESAKSTYHPNDGPVNYQTDYDVEDNLHYGYILHPDTCSVNHNFLFSTDRGVWRASQEALVQIRYPVWLFPILSIYVSKLHHVTLDIWHKNWNAYPNK